MVKFLKFTAPKGSQFGAMESFRTHPHRGADWLFPENAVVPFVCDAKIVEVFWSDELGNVVEFVDADGVYIQYAHFAKKPTSFKAGDTVKAGQPAGRCGHTGTAATGPHLHVAASRKKHPHLVDYADLIDPVKLFGGTK